MGMALEQEGGMEMGNVRTRGCDITQNETR